MVSEIKPYSTNTVETCGLELPANLNSNPFPLKSFLSDWRPLDPSLQQTSNSSLTLDVCCLPFEHLSIQIQGPLLMAAVLYLLLVQAPVFRVKIKCSKSTLLTSNSSLNLKEYLFFIYVVFNT